MHGPHDRCRLVIIRTLTSGEAERVDIVDASNYVNIMTTGEFLPGMAALRIAPPTALGINGQTTQNPSGQLPPGFSLMWTDHDTPLRESSPMDRKVPSFKRRATPSTREP